MSNERSSFLVCLYPVEGACNRSLFYHVFNGFARFCAIPRVFGRASLRDSSYWGVVSKSWCVAGVGNVCWCRVISFGGRGSESLSAAFDGNLYGLSCCGYCVVVQYCSIDCFLEARGSSNCLEVARKLAAWVQGVACRAWLLTISTIFWLELWLGGLA